MYGALWILWLWCCQAHLATNSHFFYYQWTAQTFEESIRGDTLIIIIILLKLWNYICIHLHFTDFFTTTYIFVNTVKYASSTKSQQNKIKIKTLMQAHAVCLWKKCCMSDSNWFALISQLRGWRGDTSLCLQSYKIKIFKMAAFFTSQYYPPLALCKNIYILWWFALYSVFKLASNPIQDSF